MDLKEILNAKKCFSSKIIAIEKSAVALKNGYLSDISCLVLKFENGSQEQLIEKTMLKSANDGDNNVYAEISQAVNASEQSFFEQIHSELELSLSDLKLTSPLPKCYYSDATESGSVIILEDLTRRGLKMPDLKKEIPEKDLQSILWSLAKVQIAACALQLRRQASLLELFPFLKNAFSDMIQVLIRHQLETFKGYFKRQYPNSVGLEDLLSRICLDRDLNEFFFNGKDAGCFICHGDLWNNNVFINDDECILIDWQGVSAGCPIGDIATLVMTGMDLGPEPSKRFATLVQMYLNLLLQCCGGNTALREMVKKQVIPQMSDAKMQRMALQFGAKWTIASFDCFLDSTEEVRSRVIQNIYNSVAEMPQ